LVTIFSRGIRIGGFNLKRKCIGTSCNSGNLLIKGDGLAIEEKLVPIGNAAILIGNF
jgi:hypothetical protein